MSLPASDQSKLPSLEHSHKSILKGSGTFSYNRGNYSGEIVNGQKNGYGTYQWKIGSFYEGEWANNKIEGLGQITWPDGRNYRGEWRNNVMEGFGLYSMQEGR